jgi:lysozyme family protein
MALFQQDLQTQVISEQAVQEPSAIGTISDLAGAFLKAQPSASTKGAPNYEQSLIANFSAELNTLEQLKESGSINQIDFDRRLGKARSEISKIKDSSVPQGLQNQYEVQSGRDFNSFGYDTNEEYETANLLKGEFAIAIRPSVVSELEAAGQVATPDAVDNAVLNKLEDKASLENDLNTQNKKLALGQPVDDTVVSNNIKADYDVLASFAKEALGDGIVTKNEYLSMQLSVSNQMTTKYGQFKTNPQVSAVMEQMTGLLDDIGKGVSNTPGAVLADTIQIALQNEGFSAGTIAVVRAMQEGKNIGQFQNLMANNTDGKTVADAMTFLTGADLTEDKIVEIFNTAITPSVADVAGTNPSLLSIPTVKDNPNEYETIVGKFSESAKTPTSNELLGNKEVRNSFLTSLNVAGSAVASQSDEYILGEKLLSKFASNSIVKNLEAVYSVDPQNAAQTNDVLQAGLSSERVRQALELNNRLDAGAGAGQLVMADAEGKLQLNNDMIEKNKDKLVGGAAGWAEMQGKINAAGGLEKFLQLPPMVNSAINTDASIMVSGTQYLLKDIFSIDFNKVLKLSNNLKLIDSKLVNLESLATKYQDDTDMLRGRSTNLTPSENAEVNAAINEGPSLGVPLEDIDFESNAPATPKEPDEEIVTSPIGGLNLDSSLDEILVSEGGFQNRPKDRGNYRPDGTLIGTNRGVTPNSLAEFRGVDPNTITEADIKAVTEDEARQIFKQLYFDKPKLNQLPVNLQEAVFDMQINSRRNAIRILQKLAGMPKDKRDGYIGPETLKALQGVNITNADYADARIEYYTNLAKSNPDQYAENLAGWIDRANKYRNK